MGNRAREVKASVCREISHTSHDAAISALATVYHGKGQVAERSVGARSERDRVAEEASPRASFTTRCQAGCAPTLRSYQHQHIIH